MAQQYEHRRAGNQGLHGRAHAALLTQIQQLVRLFSSVPHFLTTGPALQTVNAVTKNFEMMEH